METDVCILMAGFPRHKIGPINDLPNELLLLIFSYLGIDDIVRIVRGVCRQWRALATNSSLWKKRSLYYSSDRVDVFIQSLKFCTELETLDLGGHIELHKSASEALIDAPLERVNHLQFSSSCRTKPNHVNAILEKFKDRVTALTLCVNDELASYGLDGHSCYNTKRTTNRPGILFGVLGQFVNLKYLKLRGGYNPVWYFHEMDKAIGCKTVEELDFSEFEELCDSPRRLHRPINLTTSLIIKNKGQLKTLYLATVASTATGTKEAVLQCKDVTTLGLHTDNFEELLNGLHNVTSLTINGRHLMTRRRFTEIAKFFRHSLVLHKLTELTLVQVCDPKNLLLPAIASCCSLLRVFRSESNTLRGKGLTQLIRSVPLLEEMYLSRTYALAARHLVLAELYLPHLRIVDLSGIGFMDCMLVVRRLRSNSPQGLDIRGTCCDCSFPFDEGAQGQDSDISEDEDDAEDQRLQQEVAARSDSPEMLIQEFSPNVYFTWYDP